MSETCMFVPAHEPWMCSTHRGGIRTSLNEDRCSVVAAESIQPLTPAEIEEFDAWAASRRGKPASQGMLWALRLRATLDASLRRDGLAVIERARRYLMRLDDPTIEEVAETADALGALASALRSTGDKP